MHPPSPPPPQLVGTLAGTALLLVAVPGVGADAKMSAHACHGPMQGLGGTWLFVWEAVLTFVFVAVLYGALYGAHVREQLYVARCALRVLPACVLLLAAALPCSTRACAQPDWAAANARTLLAALFTPPHPRRHPPPAGPRRGGAHQRGARALRVPLCGCARARHAQCWCRHGQRGRAARHAAISVPSRTRACSYNPHVAPPPPAAPGGQFTGLSPLNPAVTLSSALVFGCFWRYSWMYGLGQLTGAGLAAVLAVYLYGAPALRGRVLGFV